jgi:hypothetical protein
MAIGLSYLAAKAPAYMATGDWIARQFAGLATRPSNHSCLEQCLRQRIREAKGRITQLRTVIQLNIPALVPRGASIVSELQPDTIVLSRQV